MQMHPLNSEEGQMAMTSTDWCMPDAVSDPSAPSEQLPSECLPTDNQMMLPSIPPNADAPTFGGLV